MLIASIVSFCFLLGTALAYKKNSLFSIICYLISLAALSVIAFIGMDFSPSLTAIFLVVALILCCVGEVCHRLGECKGYVWLELLQYLLSFIGIAFTFPSVYIYAVGCDPLNFYTVTAIVLAVLITAVRLFFTNRKNGVVVMVLKGLETLLFLLTGLFCVLCSLSSPALSPYGIGILCLFTAKRFEKKPFNWFVFWLGVLLMDVFLVAPMLF
ncbi:MAG: hypothetical protein IJY26_04320 [Clostridia bacterium]|nr:hypothetical protein [Clostridia bacterium]